MSWLEHNERQTAMAQGARDFFEAARAFESFAEEMK